MTQDNREHHNTPQDQQQGGNIDGSDEHASRYNPAVTGGYDWFDDEAAFDPDESPTRRPLFTEEPWQEDERPSWLDNPGRERSGHSMS